MPPILILIKKRPAKNKRQTNKLEIKCLFEKSNANFYSRKIFFSSLKNVKILKRRKKLYTIYQNYSTSIKKLQKSKSNFVIFPGILDQIFIWIRHFAICSVIAQLIRILFNDIQNAENFIKFKKIIRKIIKKKILKLKDKNLENLKKN
ncbi:hypothetical protein BpHYR1_033893 [Brachionus plicatilis]|uniref:Uncharacterized protein n=1 Tax=Brachionus plicatilis TaxID=10195 RepID=A0A3M7S6Q9_BRAPC|nr:hypothetical protein BpHYR1_033893 [Brachionus plicatilis]